MDSLCFDDNKGNTEMESVEGDTNGVDDEFGDPEVVPRVGDEYQVEIPSLVAAPYLSQVANKTGDSEIEDNLAEPFSLGLPIPIMWAHCKFGSSFGCENLESVTSVDGKVTSEYERMKVKGKNLGGFTHSQSSSKSDETDIYSCKGLKTELNQSRGKYLLPGLLIDQPWTDLEYESFLLALYVFGKNLNLLKRFVGSKKTEDILSFYYGKFFRSKGHSRWSECRKSRTRRCAYGQKIFMGWRQQEFLSRLFSHVPGECQTLLVEISRSFVEKKLLFEDYVFALKDVVGVELLIAAVGIGKGKHDLTGTAVEPTKTNHVSVRPEMPIGKACSSLTPADIIKFLTGNFRLSKARSSDLFWEAVWPRLLAKGWHSEQPMDQVVSGSKQSLVFLIPGVKKFSKRKLVKGNHYFDSISDVLNKVASEPGLLEAETQATEGSSERENRQDKRDADGVSNKQQCSYLQSRSKCDDDLVKPTVIDTSRVHNMDQHKVSQMKSLSFQAMSISTISSCSSESEHEDSEDQVEQANPSSPIIHQVEQTNASSPIVHQVEQANALRPIIHQAEQANASSPTVGQVEQVSSSYPIEDQVKCANSSNHVEEFSDKGVSIDSSDCTRILEDLNSTKVEVENHTFYFDLNLNHDENSREINENHSIQKMTSDCTKDFPCVAEIPKLRACNHGEFSHSAESTSVERKFDLNEPVSPSDLLEASEGMVFSGGIENLSYTSSQAQHSVTENHMVGEVSAENSETRMLIDLNFPQVSPELGIDMEIPSSENDNQFANTMSSQSEITQLNAMQEFPDDNKEQQSSVVNRRLSTRNRPLTTKALEALQYRFLDSAKRKRKNTESSENNSKSQCLWLDSGTITSATCDNSIGNSIAGTSRGGDCYPGINLNREAHYDL